MVPFHPSTIDPVACARAHGLSRIAQIRIVASEIWHGIQLGLCYGGIGLGFGLKKRKVR